MAEPAIEINIHLKTVFTFLHYEREDSLHMNDNFYSWLMNSSYANYIGCVN